MKWYCWVEMGDNFSTVYKLLSAKQIVNQYYDYWITQMQLKNPKQIALSYVQRQHDCIDDFVTIHWAQEQENVSNCILVEVLMLPQPENKFKFIDVDTRLSANTIQELNDRVAKYKISPNKSLEYAKDITNG